MISIAKALLLDRRMHALTSLDGAAFVRLEMRFARVLAQELFRPHPRRPPGSTTAKQNSTALVFPRSYEPFSKPFFVGGTNSRIPIFPGRSSEQGLVELVPPWVLKTALIADRLYY